MSEYVSDQMSEYRPRHYLPEVGYVIGVPDPVMCIRVRNKIRLQIKRNSLSNFPAKHLAEDVEHKTDREIRLAMQVRRRIAYVLSSRE